MSNSTEIGEDDFEDVLVVISIPEAANTTVLTNASSVSLSCIEGGSTIKCEVDGIVSFVGSSAISIGSQLIAQRKTIPDDSDSFENNDGVKIIGISNVSADLASSNFQITASSKP